MEQLDIREVLRYLPHRYPFMLVDRVLSYVPGESLVALKNVTFNEPFFQGHFPQRPVMPGVLIIEAMAQATGILAFISTNTRPTDKSLYFFAGIDNARFKQPVVPGDQLILEVEVLRVIRTVWKFNATAKVDGNVVATAEIMCAERELEP
ncbi:MAG: 3-hydroxyacyl-ACP dehydratase FabZ [Gammaproteobacteria bacterium]|nr:3-hydroxyacyl-ACP dehydratase FabZ [Gammaproteobacteria bacterium]